MDELENFPGNERSEALLFFWEVAKAIIISLAIIIPVRYFLVQPFFVKGPSMQSTFQDGDYVLIDEISYRFQAPERGDVVIFIAPNEPDEHYIKRIIALPGETIQIRDSKVIIFNKKNPKGFALDESGYLDSNQITRGELTQKLDGDDYFVMGDNRLHSSDSRVWGLLNHKLITGRVFFRALPLAKIETFGSVEYQ
ncbi:MAG: Signal peptidase I [Parcubacteria group bacterium GW2011_GWB1_48_6]|nr:MAG: Signal peptidase I [Parcubacteria group bacterium GW2011_GWB1_48_6]